MLKYHVYQGDSVEPTTVSHFLPTAITSYVEALGDSGSASLTVTVDPDGEPVPYSRLAWARERVRWARRVALSTCGQVTPWEHPGVFFKDPTYSDLRVTRCPLHYQGQTEGHEAVHGETDDSWDITRINARATGPEGEKVLYIYVPSVEMFF